MPITTTLRRIIEARETLSLADATALMQQVLAGEASEIELAALLGALAARGETAAELAGFALALRSAAAPLPLAPAEREQLVDTCGTGGDAGGTFNISTAAALVAAAAGAKVAKHGNRAVTSQCGSADVLEALGIPVDLAPQAAADALRAHGFCFLFAPAHHPALKAVMPVRRALGVRTILHVLGPLLNPAGAQRQVMGVYQSRLVPLVAEAMTLLGTKHAIVVYGDGQSARGLEGSARGLEGSARGLEGSARGLDGIDELALSGPSETAELRNGHVAQYTVNPEELGLCRAPRAALAGGDAAQNARILTAIFTGAPGPPRDIVLLNAAAVLVTAGLAEDLRGGIAQAAATIDSGAVSKLVHALQAQ